MAINFFGNIFKYRLLRKEKGAVLLLHLSFLLILLGAFITRYIGYEGVMPIREGVTENKMLSEKTYLTVYIDGDIVSIHNILFTLNRYQKGAINITLKNGLYTINS